MNILICTKTHHDARSALMTALAGHSLILCSATEAADYLADADVVLPFTKRLEADDFALGAFGFVQQFGAGVDNIDVKAAAKAGVYVANVPAGLYGNADSVAEHAIMFMLALSRRLNYVKREMEERRLSDPAGISLLRKTCCLVGLGDIGVEIARRLQPFGMRLTAVRRDPSQPVYADLRFEKVLPMDQLEAAMSEADYVVLTLPHNEQTHHVINRQSIRAMKPNSYLINVGRGGLVDPEALLSVLADGHIAGAGLDVFWEEPVDTNHPIFRYNVIATPHVAGVTDSSCAGIAEAIAENVRRYLRGDLPKHILNNPYKPRKQLG